MKRIIALALLLSTAAYSHEWAEDPFISGWFESLMQPDNPYVSCCGEADSYWADSYEVVNGQTIAIITDERDDLLPNGRVRQHRDPGTRILIPDSKIKWDKGNPTGHGIVFMPINAYAHPADGGLEVNYNGQPSIPYCYLPPGGV